MQSDGRRNGRFGFSSASLEGGPPSVSTRYLLGRLCVFPSRRVPTLSRCLRGPSATASRRPALSRKRRLRTPADKRPPLGTKPRRHAPRSRREGAALGSSATRRKKCSRARRRGPRRRGRQRAIAPTSAARRHHHSTTYRSRPPAGASTGAVSVWSSRAPYAPPMSGAPGSGPAASTKGSQLLTCIFRVELRGLEPLTPTLPAMSEPGCPNPRRGRELRPLA